MPTSTMKAVRTQPGHTAAVLEHAIPALRPTYLLIKVRAVALNPVEYKMIDYMGDPNLTLGSEVAGEVTEIGSEVTAMFSRGDRVAAITHGVNREEPDDGCFAEYALVKGDIALRIPTWLSFEEAAVLPMGLFTGGLGLYQKMRLPEPNEQTAKTGGPKIMVYGASSAMGQYATKLAILSGHEVWATCSPRNFELVYSAGATRVYDYNSPDCAKQIRQDSENSIYYAFDCISTDDSVAIASAVLSDVETARKPILHLLRYPLKVNRTDIQVTYGLTYTMLGEAFSYKGGKQFPASKTDFEWAMEFSRTLQHLLSDRRLGPIKADVQAGGLEGVLDGTDLHRKGKISGQKLVYTLG